MVAASKVDGWLQELERLAARSEPGDSSYRTARELARSWGCSQDKVVQLLHVAQDAGLLEGPIKVDRLRLDGRNQLVPAYRIKKGKVAK